MDMKHYRFLYEEIEGCAVLYSALTNPDTEEKIQILYLRDAEEVAGQKDKSSLFLCPKHADLVVMGRNSEATRKAWAKLSKHVKADKLVMADEGFTRRITGANQVIRLTSNEKSFCMIQSGWKVFMKYYGPTTVVMTFRAQRSMEYSYILQRVPKMNVGCESYYVDRSAA